MDRSAIREVLTEQEISECLQKALATLPAEEQAAIKRVQKRLGEIRGVGPMSALDLIFAIDQAPRLAQLNKGLEGG